MVCLNGTISRKGDRRRMCNDKFCAGLLLGMAAGTAIGVRVKANERKLRRTVNRATRSMENIIDELGR